MSADVTRARPGPGAPQPEPDGFGPLPWRLAPHALAVLAIVVGCIELGQASFWFDEAFSVGLTVLPVAEFARALVGWEANQSLYYVLLRLWPLHGMGEAGARLLSVLFTAATAPLLYELGRRLYDRATGFTAGLLLAVLPFALQATQEARGYSLLMLMATAGALALVRASDQGGRWWAVYAISIGAMSYTHFYGALVVLGHLLWAAVYVTDRRRLLAAAAFGALLAAPMGVFFAVRGTGHLNWLGPPDWGVAGRFVRDFGAGRAWVGAALLVLCVVGLVIGLLRAHRATSLLLTWTAVGLLPPIVYSLTVTPIFQVRYLAGLTPALALLIAVALSALPRPRTQAVVTTAVTALLITLLPGHAGPLPHEDWRTAVGTLNTRVGPDDQVVAYPYYEAAAVNVYRSPAYLPLDTGAPTEPTAARLWVVGREDPPDMPGYRLAETQNFGEVDVRLYVGTPTG